MLTIITLVLCVVVFVRLFTYSRHGARYRPWVSIFAAVVMAASGATALLIVTDHLEVSLYALPLVLVLAVFAVSVSRCRGNLSEVARWAGGLHARSGR